MMTRSAIAALIGLVSFSGTVWAQQPTGQQELDCKSFTRNSDGTWASTGPVELIGQNGRVRVPPGLPFKRGQEFAGWDIALQLGEQCP